MRRTATAIFALAAVVAAGCAPPPQAPTATFVPSDAAYIHRSGTGAVKGQAFARQQGGGIVTAAGEEVYLVPATPYFREIAAKARTGQPLILDTEIQKFHKTTVADGDGRFSFSGLHPGDYIVMARVRWNIGGDAQGGMVYAQAGVQNGKTAEVVAAR